MSAQTVYQALQALLDQFLSAHLDRYTRTRLALLCLGIIKAKSAAPARIAQALDQLAVTQAQRPSLERRLRPIQNDPYLTPARCLQPLAQQLLAQNCPPRLLLIVDLTSQEARLSLLCLWLWYRGRALPLVWQLWPANQPLEGAGLWERVQALLAEAAPLLPEGVPVIVLADRAFGCPAFIDLVRAQGWDDAGLGLCGPRPGSDPLPPDTGPPENGPGPSGPGAAGARSGGGAGPAAQAGRPGLQEGRLAGRQCARLLGGGPDGAAVSGQQPVPRLGVDCSVPVPFPD